MTYKPCRVTLRHEHHKAYLELVAGQLGADGDLELALAHVINCQILKEKSNPPPGPTTKVLSKSNPDLENIVTF